MRICYIKEVVQLNMTINSSFSLRNSLAAVNKCSYLVTFADEFFKGELLSCET